MRGGFDPSTRARPVTRTFAPTFATARTPCAVKNHHACSAASPPPHAARSRGRASPNRRAAPRARARSLLSPSTRARPARPRPALSATRARRAKSLETRRIGLLERDLEDLVEPLAARHAHL